MLMLLRPIVAYNKEDCDGDPGWCFKAAVGRSLPSTFFSYGRAPVGDPARIPALGDMIAGMGSPSYNMSELPSAGTSSYQSSSAFEPAPTINVGIFPGVRRRSRLSSKRWSRPLHRRETRPQKRDGQSQLSVDPEQRAISKGYSDGFLTAKIFALYGMSKLGFTGQYIDDSIAKLGHKTIQRGMEHYYEQWFMEGLSDGEGLISSYVE